MNFNEIDIGELGRNIFAKILKATSNSGSFQDVLEECEYRGKQYTDESFAPNKTSLINDWKDQAQEV